MVSYLRKGVLGIFFIFTASTLANFAGYMTRLLLARNLTPTEVGLFYSIYTIITLLLLLTTFGLHTSTVKHIAEFRANNQHSKLAWVFKSISAYRMVSVFFLAGILYFSANFLARIYFKNALAAPVLEVFSFTIVFIVIIAIFSSLFHGLQNMLRLALITFSEKFFFLISFIILMLVSTHKNVLLAAYALLFGSIITSLFFLPLILKYGKLWQKSLGKSLHKKELLQKITSFGFAAFLISLGNMIIGYLDTIVLTYFRPLSEVGIYNVVLPTVIIIGFLSRSISQVFFPMVSEFKAKNLYEELNQGISLLHNYSLLIVIPLAVTMFVFPEFIISLLFGQEYLGGALAMRILSIGVIFFTIGTIDQSIISGIGKPRTVTKIVLIASIFNIVANVMLIPVWGMNAAALTTTISYFLIMGLTLSSLNKNLKFKIGASKWAKFFLLAVILIAFMQLIKVLIANPYLSFFTSLVLGSFLYLILAIALKIFNLKEFKSIIQNILNKKEVL
jgi:stage V sporulation protein B